MSPYLHLILHYYRVRLGTSTGSLYHLIKQPNKHLNIKSWDIFKTMFLSVWKKRKEWKGAHMLWNMLLKKKKRKPSLLKIRENSTRSFMKKKTSQEFKIAVVLTHELVWTGSSDVMDHGTFFFSKCQWAKSFNNILVFVSMCKQ